MTQCPNRLTHVTVLLVGFAYLSESVRAHADSATAAPTAVVAYSLTRVTDSAPWERRSGQSVVAFGDKAWVIGGRQAVWNYRCLSDVWSSPDGVTWTQATAQAGWQPRAHHSTVVFDNRIYMMGGYGDSVEFNDVWSSPDGVIWTEVTPHAAWTSLFTQAVVFCEKMWLFADWQDIWSSSDGVTWMLDGNGMPWQARQGYAALLYAGRLWAMGGYYPQMYAPTTFFRDVWGGSDGMGWMEATESAPWHARSGLATVAFDNAMWIGGGEYWTGGGQHQTTYPLKDLWRSIDGVEWERMPDMPYPGMSVCVFSDKLWMIGGAYTENIEVPYEPYVITRTIHPQDVWCLSRVDLSISAGHGSWYEVGDPLNLTLVATGLEKGAGPPGCQWLKDNSVIPGATDTTYHVDALTSGDAAAYTCQVTMPGYTQPVTTNPVEVRVFPAGSLPACGVTGTLLSACACLLLGIRTLSRQQNNRKSAPSC